MLESQDTLQPQFQVDQYIKHKDYPFCVRKVISVELSGTCGYEEFEEPQFVYGFAKSEEKETGENYQPLPDLILDNLEEWISPGSHCISAWETFSGEVFQLRSGEHVSILSLNGRMSDSSVVIHLKGPVFVGSDSDCWKIVNKFNLFDTVIDKVMEAAENRGIQKAKAKMRAFKKEQDDWLYR